MIVGGVREWSESGDRQARNVQVALLDSLQQRSKYWYAGGPAFVCADEVEDADFKVFVADTGEKRKTAAKFEGATVVDSYDKVIGEL